MSRLVFVVGTGTEVGKTTVTAAVARMLADGHLIGELAKYHGPTLVACGSVDQVTPEAQSREVAAATSTHAYCSLPDLGHACYAEAPDRVNAVIRDFCASIGVGRAG